MISFLCLNLSFSITAHLDENEKTKQTQLNHFTGVHRSQSGFFYFYRFKRSPVRVD